MRDITASGNGRMNLEMEGREEQDSELVRAAARRLTLSLMALCKLFTHEYDKKEVLGMSFLTD